MGSFVLIHGGGHDASCWESTADLLRRRGHDARAIDLPGRRDTAARIATVTLAHWVSAIHDAVDDAPERPVLVAHSAGGVACGQFLDGHPDTVLGIVYVNAITPTDGKTGLETLAEVGPESVLSRPGAITVSADGTLVTVSPDHAVEAFYGRCPADVQAAAVPRLHPEPAAPLVVPLHLSAGFADVAKIYIGSTDDRAVPPMVQREFAAAIDARFEEIDADHSPFYSARDALVDRLEAALGELRD